MNVHALPHREAWVPSASLQIRTPWEGWRKKRARVRPSPSHCFVNMLYQQLIASSAYSKPISDTWLKYAVGWDLMSAIPLPEARTTLPAGIPEQYLTNLSLKPPLWVPPEPPEAIAVLPRPALWKFLGGSRESASLWCTRKWPSSCGGSVGLYCAARVAQTQLFVLVALFQSCWLAQGNSTAISPHQLPPHVWMCWQSFTLLPGAASPTRSFSHHSNWHVTTWPWSTLGTHRRPIAETQSISNSESLSLGAKMTFMQKAEVFFFLLNMLWECAWGCKAPKEMQGHCRGNKWSVTLQSGHLILSWPDTHANWLGWLCSSSYHTSHILPSSDGCSVVINACPWRPFTALFHLLTEKKNGGCVSFHRWDEVTPTFLSS